MRLYTYVYMQVVCGFFLKAFHLQFGIVNE